MYNLDGWQKDEDGLSHFISGLKSLCGEMYIIRDEVLNAWQSLPVCSKCIILRWDL